MEWRVKSNESYDEYGMRLYRNQELYGLERNEISDILNEAFDMNKAESTHRCYFKPLIKGYDMGVSEVVTKGKTNSLTPKSHLERYEELIGEYGLAKRDMQLERNELAKLQREASGAVLLVHEYRDLLQRGFIEIPKFEYVEPKIGRGVLKSLPSDWHIGLKIEEEYNTYNFNVAVSRIHKFANKCMEYADIFNCGTIDITSMGDIVEGFEMRAPQKWDCEFTASEQIEYARKLLLDFVMIFLNNGYAVRLGGVYGNHCRMTGNKHESIGKDNVTYVIMEQIKATFEFVEENLGHNYNIEFADQDEYYEYQVDTILGKTIKCGHGHKEQKADKSKLAKHSKIDNTPYDIMIMGHLHHGEVIHRDRSELEIYCGCLPGANEYGKDNIKSVTGASQKIIIFRDNGDVIPFEVDLQYA